MTDTIIPSARKDFAARAMKPPQKTLERAGTFIDTMQKLSASGETPSPEQIARGKRLEKTLDLRTEQFSFWSAIKAGETSATDQEMAARLQVIEKTYDKAKDVVRELQTTLSKYE
jgi:hypothetical protein